MCGPTAVPCLLCEPPVAALPACALAGDHQAALVPLSIGLDGAPAPLILARSSDQSVLAGPHATVAAAVVAFATRLNPFWMLLAGGIFGFAGLI